MTISEILQKAAQGGYDVKKGLTAINSIEKYSSVFLDPLFWQSLGKAMGWEQGEYGLTGLGDNLVPCWHGMMLRFIDHLAESKTIAEFFNQF